VSSDRRCPASSSTSSPILNLMILVGVVGYSRRMRAAYLDEPRSRSQLNKRGLMNRILSGDDRLSPDVADVPIGLLFGLGSTPHRGQPAGAGRRVAGRLQLRPWYAVLTPAGAGSPAGMSCWTPSTAAS